VRRICLLCALTAMMATMLVVFASPGFAAGAQKQARCYEGTVAVTGVTGTFCERTVFTSSGNENMQQHFKPDTRSQGKVLEGGAFQFSIIVPSEQSSHLVLTPSGNAHAHNNFH
jgi:hypothetical protein